jgi:hypothetical protein
MTRNERRAETRAIEKELKSYPKNKELLFLSSDKDLIEAVKPIIDKEKGTVDPNEDMKLLTEGKHTNEILQKKFNRLRDYYSRITALEKRLQYLKVGFKLPLVEKEGIPDVKQG